MLAAGLCEQGEVGAPIVIVVKDAATVVAACEHVVGAAFSVSPRLAGHTRIKPAMQIRAPPSTSRAEDGAP